MKIISKRRRRIIVYYRTFGPDVDNNGADELETIRKNGWLINEANLVFHVDGDAMTNGLELIEYTCMISRIIVLYLIM
jgi:hypothetical protein